MDRTDGVVNQGTTCNTSVIVSIDTMGVRVKVEEAIGRRIASLRERAGMSQAELGEYLGELLTASWPRQSVSVAEKGGRKLTAVELYAIALVLSVPVAQLFVAPPELDVVDFPSGKTVEAAVLRGPHRPDPLAPDAVLPVVLLELTGWITELERRAGYDRAAVTKARQLHERLSSSLGLDNNQHDQEDESDA